MLMCGIIDTLERNSVATDLLSYFFCLASDSNNNCATSVLRGLIYDIVKRQRSLICHVRAEYDSTGRLLFTDTNAWQALSRIFFKILGDPNLRSKTIYLLVDAVDECVNAVDRKDILELIINASKNFSHVKWIISSRGWTEISKVLEGAENMIHISVEPNSKTMENAVKVYIQHKVNSLAKEKKYDENMEVTVRDHLTAKANGTFLWVALVCKELENLPHRHQISSLRAFPADLDELYGRMMNQIEGLERDSELCKQVLAITLVVKRPLSLQELGCLVEELEEFADDETEMKDVINKCGSFLFVQENTVYFVHQSAKDYLMKQGCKVVFPRGDGAVHFEILSRSFKVMTKVLQHSMFKARTVGTLAEYRTRPDPDPLRTIGYSCVYWAHHIEPYGIDCNFSESTIAGIIQVFLQDLLHNWIESLCFLDHLQDGYLALRLCSCRTMRKEPQKIPRLFYQSEEGLQLFKTKMRESKLTTFNSY